MMGFNERKDGHNNKRTHSSDDRPSASRTKAVCLMLEMADTHKPAKSHDSGIK